MGLFRDMLNEARNTSVPTEYRIALGQLKRMYNKGEVPSEKELQKDAEMIAKKNHIEEDKFFEFVKSQFKINEAKSKEDLVKYYEKNLKNVEKEYSTDSRKQEYIDYAKGQLAAVKKDGNVGLIKFLKDWNMNEAKITKSDSGEFTLIDGVIQITKKELAKIHKDYKSDKTLLTMINGRTVSVPFVITEAKKEFDKDATPEDKANAIMKRCKAFRADSTVGYLLNDADIIQGITDATKWSFRESEKYFKDNYKSIKMNEVYSRSIGFKQTEEAIKLLVRQLDVNSNLAKGIIKTSGNIYGKDFINMNKNITHINDIWDDMSVEILKEAAVGQKGRTSYKEAMDYCEENEELVDEFRKIIKKLGGKTVAKALLDKLSQKPEIKDEIEHIEDIIDNSNY